MFQRRFGNLQPFAFKLKPVPKDPADLARFQGVRALLDINCQLSSSTLLGGIILARPENFQCEKGIGEHYTYILPFGR